MDLLKLNRRFYLRVQKYFNRSRQFYWDGWKKLLPYLQGPTLKVLDLGCGNGRFGKFLAEHKIIDYTGLDNNQYLLNRCREALPQAKLIKQDILKPWPLKEKFDLIVLFAVLHHIPTAANRLKILQRAEKLLKPKGLLVFTVWHFNKLKIVKKIGNNDFLLYWKKGVKTERYVHLFDDAEIAWLITKLKMKLVDDFVSDGQQGQSNRYLILRK